MSMSSEEVIQAARHLLTEKGWYYWEGDAEADIKLVAEAVLKGVS